MVIFSHQSNKLIGCIYNKFSSELLQNKINNTIKHYEYNSLYNSSIHLQSYGDKRIKRIIVQMRPRRMNRKCDYICMRITNACLMILQTTLDKLHQEIFGSMVTPLPSIISQSPPTTYSHFLERSKSKLNQHQIMSRSNRIYSFMEHDSF